MQLKELPIGEVQTGINLPGWKKTSKSEWARLFKKMKVDDCVRLESKKQADALKAYFRARNVPTRVRAVGDGSFVVWRLRKKVVRQAEPKGSEEVFPSPTLFDA